MARIRAAARHLHTLSPGSLRSREGDEGPGASLTLATEAALVAKLAGSNGGEHVVETTAWGDGGSGSAGRPPAGDAEARASELLSTYAPEAPSTLKSDRAKLHYLKGQYYSHVASWMSPAMRRRGGGSASSGSAAPPRSPARGSPAHTPRTTGTGEGPLLPGQLSPAPGSLGGALSAALGRSGELTAALVGFDDAGGCGGISAAVAAAASATPGGGGGGSEAGSSTGSAAADIISLPGSPFASCEGDEYAADASGAAVADSGAAGGTYA